MKTKVSAVFLMLFFLFLTAGATYAVLTDKAKILGASFSVGSADIRLLSDVTGGVDPANLVDEMPGPSFEGVGPYWSKDYLVKIYNNSATAVALTTNAYYETVNDPAELRQIIFVEPFGWADADSDGVVDAGELGASLGRKTIVKWKTEGFDLGTLDSGVVKSLVLRLSTDSVAESKFGATALFNFEFNSAGLE